MTVNFEDIEDAAARIAPYIHLTPMFSSSLINDAAACTINFKCENLQKVGAFKARGAHNAVLLLSDAERAMGVATHSSGNHAAALALAASRFDIPAYIVMPENSPAVKVAAVKQYGGQITFCEPSLSARETTLASLQRETGAYYVPPYDHPHIIAGQGTAALELREQLSVAPDIVLTPVGGGGLLAGTAIAVKQLWPNCLVYGAEPSGADDARRSFYSGERLPQTSPKTLCDGLLTSLGDHNFSIIQQQVDDILCADDKQVVEAMQWIWSRMKLIVEPSAAITLAVVMKHASLFRGKQVSIILSGGNVDLNKLPW